MMPSGSPSRTPHPDPAPVPSGLLTGDVQHHAVLCRPLRVLCPARQLFVVEAGGDVADLQDDLPVRELRGAPGWVSKQPPKSCASCVPPPAPPGRGRSCLGDDGWLKSPLGDQPFPGGRRLGRDAAGEVDAVPLAQHRLRGLDADGWGLCRGEGVSGVTSLLCPQPRGSGRGTSTQSCALARTAGAKGPAAQRHQDAALPALQRLVPQLGPAPVLPELQPVDTTGAAEGISHQDAGTGQGRGQRLTRAVAAQARGRAPAAESATASPAPAAPILHQALPGRGCTQGWVPCNASHPIPVPMVVRADGPTAITRSVSPAPLLPPCPPRAAAPVGEAPTRLSPHHSQLLQGQMLEGFPREVVQRVGGEVPAGTDPISRPFLHRPSPKSPPQPLQGAQPMPRYEAAPGPPLSCQCHCCHTVTKQNHPCQA